MEHVWKIYVAAWISAMVTACVGTYFTHSAWCLWVMVLPACLSYSSDNKNKDNKSGGEGESNP